MPFLAPLFAALAAGGGAAAAGTAGAAAAGLGALGSAATGAAAAAPAVAAGASALPSVAAGLGALGTAATGAASAAAPAAAGGLTSVGNFLSKVTDNLPKDNSDEMQIGPGSSFGGSRLPRQQIASRPMNYGHPGAEYIRGMIDRGY